MGSVPAERDTNDELLAEWDEMSEHYLPGRNTLLDAVVDRLVNRFGDGGSVTIVELGSGPGTFLARLAAAFPSARLVGVEIDPVLRRLHQLGPVGVRPDLIRVVEADLADPRWLGTISPLDPVDAVVAVQVLHYFSPERFASLLQEIRWLLAPGGVFVHLDRVPHGQPVGRITAEQNANRDPWSTWWAAARNHPALSESFRERDGTERRTPPSAEYHPDAAHLRDHFEDAGLRDVVVKQRHGDALLTIVAPPTNPSRSAGGAQRSRHLRRIVNRNESYSQPNWRRRSWS